MVYTIIGDIHATLKDTDKVNHLFDIIEQIGNPTILLGDLLDNKAIVRAECLNLYYKRFKESKLNFIVLVGNHDLISLDSKEHSLETLKELKNVTIIDEPQVIDNVFFVPYIHDLVALKSVLASNSVDTLMIHQGIVGYDYGNGYKAEEGVVKEQLSSFKRVIAGHFHKYQHEDKLTFLGTPFSKSFGETDQDKFIACYETETQSLELIKSNFPQHKSLNVDCSSPQEINLVEGDIYRFILNGTQEQINSFPKKEYLNVRFIERPTDEFETSVSIDETVDCVSQFEDWARNIKGVDDETVKIGAEILRSCK